MRMIVAGLLVLLAIDAGVVGVASANDAAVQEEIRERIERMRAGELVIVEGAPIVAVDVVPDFYERRQFRQAFTDPASVAALIDEIKASQDDGLRPIDFHLDIITELAESPPSAGSDPAAAADFDILLTDTLVRLHQQLYFGKVDPAVLDPNWNLSRPETGWDTVAELEAAVTGGEIARYVDRARLDDTYYRALKSALRSHREIASAGGWPMVPSGPALKPGMVDERVAALRRRLSVGGDFDWTETGDPALYDPALEDGVRRFQTRHGIEPDAVVGPATIAALNVPVEARIAQIRANLERARWVLRTLGDDYILVNIAGFYVQVVRSGELAWESRAIVGRPYRETPIFTANMTYLVINPTWTVPPTILKEDILPKAGSDPGYIASKGYQIVDSAGGVVAPATIDWQSLNGSFPFRIVQPPGPDNALGLVKFMFPNDHHVYLHDTPSRALFDRAERGFSSGCIRVERPFELAELLLAGQSDWSRPRIDEIKTSGKTTTAYLAQPVPVLILYWTVDPDLVGNVRLLNDIYGRDAAIIRALDSDDEVARR